MTPQREVHIAAMADLHFDGSGHGWLRSLLADVCREADILVLCGDLTTHGKPEQARALVAEMEGAEIPIVAVLGNHDYEAQAQDEIRTILRERGIHVLDGNSVVVEGIGFAGVKGFGGGFGRGALGPFGERLYKEFVQEALDEAIKLESAFRSLNAEVQVALLHYAPIRETLEGEPEEIFPFLGSSRLLPPLETYTPDVVFHGHAHIGALEAATPSGIPVYNVACSLLREKTGKSFRIWTTRAPDRRRSRQEEGEEEGQEGEEPS